jgi:hypothetical protein
MIVDIPDWARDAALAVGGFLGARGLENTAQGRKSQREMRDNVIRLTVAIENAGKELSGIRTEIHEQINGLRVELHDQVKNVKADLCSDIKDVKEDLRYLKEENIKRHDIITEKIATFNRLSVPIDAFHNS